MSFGGESMIISNFSKPMTETKIKELLLQNFWENDSISFDQLSNQIENLRQEIISSSTLKGE